MLERAPLNTEAELAAVRAELAQARAQLAAARHGAQWTQALLAHLQAGVVLCSAQGQIRYANPKAREILGSDDLDGQDALASEWDMHHPDGRPLARAEHPIAQVMARLQPVRDCHLTLRRPDGEPRWVSINALPVLDEQGGLREVAVTFLDLTHDEMAMRATALARETMSRFVQAAPLGICVTDEHGLFEQVNPHYCEFYGYSREELIGRHFSVVVPDDAKETLSRLHDRFIRDGMEMRGEWKVRARSGEIKTVLADAVRIQGNDGRPKKVTFIVDISHRIHLEQALRRSNDELQHLAITDGLTGLYNRRHITRRLEEELQRAQRYQTPLSIFLFDLDHFKRINDTHGHAMGDRALVEVAAMLRHELRGVDLIGRYGGEEFLVVLPYVDLAAARSVADRLRIAARELSIGEPGLAISLSGGVMEAAPGEGAERLIQRADAALYQAKEAGRNRVCG